MTIPSLIHKVAVVIGRFTSDGGVMDQRSKQFVGGTPRNLLFSLDAQPDWRKTDVQSPAPGGSTIESDGYLLFRYVDLIMVGLVSDTNPNPQILLGMKLITLGRRTNLNYYIIRVEDTGHYDESELVKAWLADRSPGSPPR
jgi:hypothetical protein